MTALVAHVGTHPVELGNEAEPVVEDVLGDDGRAVGSGEQRDDERQEIGGEPGERQRRDVDGGGVARRPVPRSRRAWATP